MHTLNKHDIADLQLSAILHASPDGIVILNTSGKIVTLSSSSLKMFGYKHSEAIGRLPTDFIVAKDQARASSNIGSIFKDGAQILTEYTAVKSDGSVFPVEVNAEAIWESSDDIRGIILIIRDITTRKQQEEMLRKSEELYRSFLSASPDAVFITDRDGQILTVSPAVSQMFGYSSEEDIKGKQLLGLFVPDEIERIKCSLIQRINGARQILKEYKCFKQDGTIINVEVNSEYIRDNNNAIIGMVAIARDITAKKNQKKCSG